MASSDGACQIWDCQVEQSKVDNHGELLLNSKAELQSKHMPCSTTANQLYWFTDRTPHESLPVAEDGIRQFFRLVSSEIDVWWKQHSTSNPIGIQPDCKILNNSKFHNLSTTHNLVLWVVDSDEYFLNDIEFRNEKRIIISKKDKV